jgi:hypothetical protein
MSGLAIAGIDEGSAQALEQLGWVHRAPGLCVCEGAGLAQAAQAGAVLAHLSLPKGCVLLSYTEAVDLPQALAPGIQEAEEEDLFSMLTAQAVGLQAAVPSMPDASFGAHGNVADLLRDARAEQDAAGQAASQPAPGDVPDEQVPADESHAAADAGEAPSAQAAAFLDDDDEYALQMMREMGLR